MTSFRVCTVPHPVNTDADADADIQERNRSYKQQDEPAWTGSVKLCFNLCQLPEIEQTALHELNSRDKLLVGVHSGCPMY